VERGSEMEALSFEPQGEQAVRTLNHLSGTLFGVTPLSGVKPTADEQRGRATLGPF
jgi:hypothetical protein